MVTKQEEMIAKYVKQLGDMGEKVDMVLLTSVTKALGAANYKLDAQAVAAADKKELEMIYKNYVVKKMGLADKTKGMQMIQNVADKMKAKKIHKKYRAVFYYLLNKNK